MSEQTTVAVIESVTSKEGATNGRAWKKYTVKDEHGTFYSTFDAAAAEQAFKLQGSRAEITWKPSGQDGKFKDIISAAATTQDPGIPSETTDEGDRNWDVIGLRKTRCLLWAHYLDSPMAAAVAAGAGEKPPAHRVYDFGAQLVALAEADIYTRPQADESETVPF